MKKCQLCKRQIDRRVFPAGQNQKSYISKTHLYEHPLKGLIEICTPCNNLCQPDIVQRQVEHQCIVCGNEILGDMRTMLYKEELFKFCNDCINKVSDSPKAMALKLDQIIRPEYYSRRNKKQEFIKHEEQRIDDEINEIEESKIPDPNIGNPLYDPGAEGSIWDALITRNKK